MNSPLNELQDPSVFKSDALIDGRWVGAGERFAATDPAAGTVLALVASRRGCRR